MAKKTGKRRKSGFFTIFILLLVIILIAGAIWYFVLREREEQPAVQTGELSFHFLDVGNANAGDSIYIQYENMDILIDAGSKRESAKPIGDYIASHSADGVLDYVIATHAHEDHIAGFAGTSKVAGIFDRFAVKTIIDFPRTNSSSKVYSDYCAARDAEVEGGAVHYTALQCWKEEDGAKRSYVLDGEGNVTMNVLYNYYYEHSASGENNYSVCLLFTQGNKSYLFTGDLEAEGERHLVADNTLPQVALYKAGHHGSKTSSSDELLRVIRPENVCVCCCAGTTEYTDIKENTFPTQAMIDRVAPYTKNIYVVSRADESAPGGYSPLNGTITVRSDGLTVTVEGSDNSTILKDTAWFAANRTWPANGVS